MRSASRRCSVGAFYTYISQALGVPSGIAGAALAISSYKLIQIAVYALFGIFAAAMLAKIGIVVPWWVPVLAIAAVVTLAGSRNIVFSGHVLSVCMVCEVLILFVLGVKIVLEGGGPEGMSLTSFAPTTVFAPGFGVALVFVVGSYIGFEATALYAEEARDPARTVPRATYAAALLIAGFYGFSTWAITQHYGPSQVQASGKARRQRSIGTGRSSRSRLKAIALLSATV
ncbi:APC family permease [Aureimonas psammosilenae]|uniref:APC family permease n=1 Tax=Aureimonas psammosilenae TaxID=2495496 RepID=UPI001F27F918|nr:amino acid permease [Aureimonas psammosilenae]